MFNLSVTTSPTVLADTGWEQPHSGRREFIRADRRLWYGR